MSLRDRKNKSKTDELVTYKEDRWTNNNVDKTRKGHFSEYAFFCTVLFHTILKFYIRKRSTTMKKMPKKEI